MKRTLSFLLAVILVMSLSAAAFASAEQPAATEITQNTLEVMMNSSSEGGGNLYALPGPTAEEFQALIDKYVGLGYFDMPENAGVTEYPGTYPRDLIETKTTEELTPVVEAVVAAATLEEKVGLFMSPPWGTNKQENGQALFIGGIPRLGVPCTYQHDASAGVTAPYPTTNLPIEALGGCSFDTDMGANYGKVLGTELVSVGSNYELGAQYDLTRTITWTRADDSFGEDQYLVGELAVAEVDAMQHNGAGAEGKHIGAYCTSGDGQLWTFVDEQTLHTLYLYTFEQPMVRADMASVMTTYTRLNGYYTYVNEYMLKDVLRGMWNWHGAATTDAMSTYEFSLAGGIDVEMGEVYNKLDYVLKYLDEGIITMEDIDNAVRHNLYSLGYAGYLNLVQVDPDTGLAYEDPNRGTCTNGEYLDTNRIYIYGGDDIYEGGERTVILMEKSWQEDYDAGLYAENNALALEVAEESIVLAKNENSALPLTAEDYTGGHKVVFLGDRADDVVIGEGGERSHGFFEFVTTPFDSAVACAEAQSGSEEPAFEAYDFKNSFGELLDSDYVYADEDCTVPGWAGASGEIVDSVELLATYEFAKNAVQNKADGKALSQGESAEYTAYLKAPESGDYRFFAQAMGGSMTVTVESLDGSTIGTKAAGSASGEASGGASGSGESSGEAAEPEEVSVLSVTASATELPQESVFQKDGLVSSAMTATLETGKVYKVTASVNATSAVIDGQFRAAFRLPSDTDEAVKAAGYAAAGEPNTKVVYFLEVSDGNYYVPEDKVSEVKELSSIAHAAGNPFVVVCYNFTAFAFDGDWLDDIDALVMAYYPGQAGGTALGEILTGAVNPSGSFAQTFPAKFSDTLTYWEAWDENGNGEYDEGENYDWYMGWRRDGRGSSLYGDSGREYYAEYNEGLNIGYRWYDSIGAEPAFWFGYGLSYTTFDYSDMSFTANGDGTVTATVTVTNTGGVPGADCVQVYVGAIPDNAKPDYVQTTGKQLVQFARTEELRPGESQTLEMVIGSRMLSYWDVESELIERGDGTRDKWILAACEREFTLRTSADDADILFTQTVEVK